MASYYDKPIHQRIASRIVETVISTAVVYLFMPQLLGFLAPLQAGLNANALNNGKVPPTQGANAVANSLIQPAAGSVVTIPSNTPQGI